MHPHVFVNACRVARGLTLPATLLVLSVQVAAAPDYVVVVSAKSDVASLSKNDVSDIFLGKRNNFPSGGVAVPVDLAETLPAHENFHEAVTGKSPTQLKAYWAKMVFSGKAKPPKQVPTEDEMAKLVATSPGTLGYVPKDKVDSNLKVVYTP